MKRRVGDDAERRGVDRGRGERRGVAGDADRGGDGGDQRDRRDRTERLGLYATGGATIDGSTATSVAGKGVYVAVSASELTTTKSVAERENETVDLLLQVRGEKKKQARLVRLKMQAAPDPELAILGGLAHELAHALLADTNADGVDEHHPRREISGPPQSSCFEDAIIGTSWDADQFHHNMTRWVAFGDQSHNRPKNRELRFNLNRLREQAERGRLDRANDVLEQIYRSQEFISVAAAIRPEEDLVETYKYKVLNDAGGRPVEFRFGRQKVSVPDRLKSGVLEKKVECLRALGLLTGQP